MCEIGNGLGCSVPIQLHFKQNEQGQGYDFHAHATDWGDATQLFYLCDPQMHILTMDENCRNHTAGSSQSGRILLWREFVRSIK